MSQKDRIPCRPFISEGAGSIELPPPLPTRSRGGASPGVSLTGWGRNTSRPLNREDLD